MKHKYWLLLIVILIVINLFLFWPGRLYFLNDDLLHIPLTDAGELFQTNSVRPLHELLVRLDLLIWGKRAFGFHVTALLLHLVVCIQLFELTLVIGERWLKLVKDKALQASSLAVVLFLLYPQNTEAIAWILGRTAILSSIFFLVTFRLFFVPKFTWLTYALGAISFTASLFTYEQGFLLPLVLLAFSLLTKEKQERQKHVIYSLVLFLVVLGYMIARLLITSEVVGNYEGGNFRSLNFSKLAVNAVGLVFRLWLNPATPAVFVGSVISFLFLIAVLFLFLKNKIKVNKEAFIFFTAIVLLLVLPVVSLGISVRSFESGRFLYLPSVFLISGISIAFVSAYYQNIRIRNALITILLFFWCYWLFGKYQASLDYVQASNYARSIEQKVQKHFAVTSDTLYIDTLQGSYRRLPVFRLGFISGIKWLNNTIDTNKIIVNNYIDEVAAGKK